MDFHFEIKADLSCYFIGLIDFILNFDGRGVNPLLLYSNTQTTLVDVTRSKGELGLTYLPMAQTLREMAASLIDLGIVQKKTR